MIYYIILKCVLFFYYSGCNRSLADVIFVLDSSGSVGPTNFTVMKSFVKEIVNNLDISPDRTRVGLITFSRYPALRIQLTDYTNSTQLLAAIDKVPYVSGKSVILTNEHLL